MPHAWKSPLRRISAGAALSIGSIAGCYGITEPPKASAPTTGVDSMTLDPKQPVADGTTPVTLTFWINAAKRLGDGKISLVTSHGAFLGGNNAITVTANAAGKAQAILRAPSDTAIATISALVANVAEYRTISFAVADAQRVLLTTNDFGVKAGAANAMTVTLQLIRAVGTVSPGVTVIFSADTLKGTSHDFGQFSPQSAESTGSSVTARFSSGQTTFRGTAVIRATAVRGSKSFTDSVFVQILPP